MTGDHGIKFTQDNGKDVPRFAPNFTVYVLPPDVVCLYSEDRKFLLHGELYCVLASAIGKGEKSFRGCCHTNLIPAARCLEGPLTSGRSGGSPRPERFVS